MTSSHSPACYHTKSTKHTVIQPQQQPICEHLRHAIIPRRPRVLSIMQPEQQPKCTSHASYCTKNTRRTSIQPLWLIRANQAVNNMNTCKDGNSLLNNRCRIRVYCHGCADLALLLWYHRFQFVPGLCTMCVALVHPCSTAETTD